MYAVYVLRSKKDKGLYVGYTHNLKRRIDQHNNGGTKSTKDRRPLDLLYCELYKNKTDAMRRESFLKTGWGRNYLKKTLEHTLQEL
jgi:putative endonuclease